MKDKEERPSACHIFCRFLGIFVVFLPSSFFYWISWKSWKHSPFFSLTSSFARKLGSLSKEVFERPMSTGSEALSLLICLEATKFVFFSAFSLIETICLKIWLKSRHFRLTRVAQKRRCLNSLGEGRQVTRYGRGIREREKGHLL